MKFTPEGPVRVRAKDIESVGVVFDTPANYAATQEGDGARVIAGLLRVLANNILGHGLPVEGGLELVNMFGERLGFLDVKIKEGADYAQAWRVAVSGEDADS